MSNRPERIESVDRTADVLIVGGGIVGCAAARELALAGRKVLVIERAEVGSGASGAAGGMLSPQTDARAPGPLLDFGLQARREYPGLVDELRAETGIDPGYRARGTLAVAFTAGELRDLEEVAAWQASAGLPVERVPDGGLASLEPSLGPAAAGGVFFPADNQVDNVQLVRALAASAARRGARFLFGRAAGAIVASGGRFEGLMLEGERLSAPLAVIAAGCWSGGIEGLPEQPSLHPVRGQMVQLETSPGTPSRALLAGEHYLVPRGDGRVVAGSTQERVGFRSGVTAGGIGAILTAAVALVPSLGGAAIRETWSGLRPGTPDGLPVIGASTLAGLFYATGHFRSGILLGPLTGRIVREMIVTGRSSVPVDAFSPQRQSLR
jgi:glycine oxidase